MQWEKRRGRVGEVGMCAVKRLEVEMATNEMRNNLEKYSNQCIRLNIF